MEPDTLAAVILEPIQGEAGVVVPPMGYLAAAQHIAHDAGACVPPRRGADRYRAHGSLVCSSARWRHAGCDVSGQGPRGRPADRRPRDVFPGRPDVAARMHGSTFGGNPVSCAAALAVLDIIEEDGSNRRVRERCG